MPLFRRLPYRVRLVLWFAAISAVIGGAYGHFQAMQDGDPLFGLAGIMRGALTGAFIGSVVSTFETMLVADAWTAPLRNVPLAVNLLIRTGILLAVILFGLLLGAWLFPAPGQVGLWLPIERRDVSFSLAVSFVLSFLAEVNRMLGQNVLLNFVTGRYYRPRREERVFLFIDMVGSTGIAERIGDLAFLRLLNRFVSDLTGPIIAERGEIHRYVGDELIATWKLANGAVEARCVRACFAAIDLLAHQAPAYRREFGLTVSFRAGLHCGWVATGEMGLVKKDDRLPRRHRQYQARIQDFCRDTGDQVLASGTLLGRFDLPPDIIKRPLGDRRLRGKESDIALYALERTTGARAVAA